MAKIVHVGNFPSGLRPGFQHGVPRKLTNGLVRNGHLVLEFADRDVARALSPLGNRKLGRRGVNRALLAFCRHHRPDVLLLHHADMIGPETVRRIRDVVPGIRIAQINVDPLFEPDNVARIQSKLDVVDVSFISTAGPALERLREGGRRTAFLPNPVDLSVETGRADLQEDLAFDLFYACGNPRRPLRHVCGRDWDMDAFFRTLLPLVPGLRPRFGGVLGAPRLEAAEYQAALEQSAMGLNISRRPDFSLYSSDRIAQLAGNGLLVLMERGSGYETLFSEQEIGFFGAIEELAELLATYSRDRQRRMAHAAAGRRRYIDLFNERRVAAYIMDVLDGARDPLRMPWEPA